MDTRVVCIGLALVDLTFKTHTSPRLRTSNPSIMFRTAGGVTRNIAHHLSLLNIPVQFITVFGNDHDGEWLNRECRKAGIQTVLSITGDQPSGIYCSLIDPAGDLIIGAVSNPPGNIPNSQLLEARKESLSSATCIVSDCNLSTDTLTWLTEFCDSENIPLFIETVSSLKAKNLNDVLPGNIFLIKPNRDELEVFGSENDSYYSTEERIPWLHNKGVKNVWLSLGEKGSLFSDGRETFLTPAPVVHLTDTTGAGDAAMSGWIWAWLQGKNPRECVRYGHALAGAVMEVSGAVRKDLRIPLLKEYYQKIK